MQNGLTALKKIFFLLYLFIYSECVDSKHFKRGKKHRKHRGIGVAGIIVIAAIILTPIIIGSATAGYVLAVQFRTSNDGPLRQFFLFKFFKLML